MATGQEAGCSHLHSHTGSREGGGYKPSKLPPVTQFHPKGSIISLNSATNWGLCLSTCACRGCFSYIAPNSHSSEQHTATADWARHLIVKSSEIQNGNSGLLTAIRFFHFTMCGLMVTTLGQNPEKPLDKKSNIYTCQAGIQWHEGFHGGT